MEKISINIEDIVPMTDKGGKIYIIASPKTTGNKNLIMGIGITPAGEKVKRHVHEYSEETFYVLSGKGEIEIEGENIVFKEGMLVRVPQGKEHEVTNIGDSELVVIFASAPLAPNDVAGHKEV